ncbi:Pfam:Sec3 [Seminavis robusta]|uniref:Pfam:Sec3 n=1 Tax=Seminavis robusta TaxID=568900 RepID=A0A9N8H2G4_9STRA|nr:Pfam:Sec3 [Seminavis robusta]|eukprot:Sro18_g013180.1 Pfam:Sec3 (1490) ;mRNA; r:174261-178823
MFKLKKGKKDKGEEGDDINERLGGNKKDRNKASRQAVDPAARPSYKVYDKSKQAEVDMDGDFMIDENGEMIIVGGGGGGGEEDEEHLAAIQEQGDDAEEEHQPDGDGAKGGGQEGGGEGAKDDEDEEEDRVEYDRFNRFRHDDSPAANEAKANLILQSAGTQRLNRILRNTAIPDGATAAGRNFLGTTETKVHRVERVSNPHNLNSVAKFVERIVCPPLKVDAHSIGGEHDSYPEHKMIQETLLCFKLHAFETSGSTETVHMGSLERPAEYAKHKRGLGFFGVGGAGKGTNRNKLRYALIVRSTNAPLMEERKREQTQKQNEALRKETMEADANRDREAEKDDIGYDTMYSADAALGPGPENRHGSMSHMNSSMPEMGAGGGAATNNNNNNNEMDGSLGDNTDYSDGGGDDGDDEINPNLLRNPMIHGGSTKGGVGAKGVGFAPDTNLSGMDEFDFEISSFPVLVCMTLYSDGTNPDVRKLVPLSQLVSIQDLQTTVLQLGFLNGDSVRLDFGEQKEKKGTHGTTVAKEQPLDEAQAIAGSMQKERFIWSLLQIHAMLCVTVVDAYTLRMETQNAQAATSKKNAAALATLPPLNVRNVDKAELQYVATVNGFLNQSPTVRALLARQKLLAEDMRRDASDVGAGVGSSLLTSKSTPLIDDGITSSKSKISDDASESKRKEAIEDMDNLAYDLMMGNFTTRVAIFHSDEERKDAEAVLNSTQWTSGLNKDDTAAASAAERLGTALQRRMRDLEAETCRRLIAWEDEKHSSASSNAHASKAANRDSVDALYLESLFNALDGLDKELQDMESWLGERAAAIKPMTDDCRDIEEENRQLEQQWKSYDMLGGEMRRLLKGLEIQDELDRVLKNPASALVYDKEGRIDFNESQDGVDNVHEAGRSLQDAMLHVQKSGGLHLKAVIERSDALEKTAASFCTVLAQIIVTIMEQFKIDVVATSDYGKVSKSDTHTMIAKKVRDTQRKFQSSLLGYIKLIEILAELSPELLPAVRDAYSEMVAEGIMMKKRMKGYFQALPGKNSSYMKNVSRDLKEYTPRFKSDAEEKEGEGKVEPAVQEGTVHADDIRFALSELLPLIAREAYFTAALFGLSNKAQDGRDKKRNFEAAKKSVDHSSQYFDYYIQRTCGIIQDFDAEAAAMNPNAFRGDPMLCLVASIHLNETMENYIDREKKGGDHSLSLAYARATILELRKKVDKQWVLWVDHQINWIRTHAGVPANGKRAGVIPSFARFPVYLDHVLLCCREGRKGDYTPNFANNKVVSYHLQKVAFALLESLRECAERESTEKTYAANVLQMENTHYFTQCIKDRGEEISALFRRPMQRANTTCKQSTEAYLGWMIKRELAVLHDLFSRIAKKRRETGDKEVLQEVPSTVFIRTLQKEASREVMKDKIGAMYARMSKHMSEEGGMLPVAWKALVKVLYEWFGRWEKLSSQCYQHTLDPSAVDIVRIAKAAGSATVSTIEKSPSGDNPTKKSILAR